jgi:hypothetical protein
MTITSGLPDFSLYNIQKREKYTKWLQNYQMLIKYTKWPENITTLSIPGPSKIYPNWYFWSGNKPSGNTGSRVVCKTVTRETFWMDVTYCLATSFAAFVAIAASTAGLLLPTLCASGWGRRMATGCRPPARSNSRWPSTGCWGRFDKSVSDVCNLQFILRQVACRHFVYVVHPMLAISRLTVLNVSVMVYRMLSRVSKVCLRWYHQVG